MRLIIIGKFRSTLSVLVSAVDFFLNSGPRYRWRRINIEHVVFTLQVPDCSLSDDFGGLFDSSQFADVVLTSGSREFHCHKVMTTHQNRQSVAIGLLLASFK